MDVKVLEFLHTTSPCASVPSSTRLAEIDAEVLEYLYSHLRTDFRHSYGPFAQYADGKLKDDRSHLVSKHRYNRRSTTRQGTKLVNKTDEISQFICRKATKPAKLVNGTTRSVPQLSTQPSIPPSHPGVADCLHLTTYFKASTPLIQSAVDELKDLRDLSSKQLRKMEKKNPEILGITNELWEKRCRVKYGSLVQNLEEPDNPYHTWKDFYLCLKGEHRIRKEERKARKFRREQRKIQKAERKIRKKQRDICDAHQESENKVQIDLIKQDQVERQQ